MTDPRYIRECARRTSRVHRDDRLVAAGRPPVIETGTVVLVAADDRLKPMVVVGVDRSEVHVLRVNLRRVGAPSDRELLDRFHILPRRTVLIPGSLTVPNSTVLLTLGRLGHRDLALVESQLANDRNHFAGVAA